MTPTWLVVRTPDGTYTWDLTGRDLVEEVPELVLRARVLTGFPCGDAWNFAEERVYDVALTSGEPHENMGAIVSELGALDSVDPGRVTSYSAECEAHANRLQVEAAEQTLAALSDEQINELIARRQGTSGLSSTSSIKGSGGSNANVRPA